MVFNSKVVTKPNLREVIHMCTIVSLPVVVGLEFCKVACWFVIVYAENSVNELVGCVHSLLLYVCLDS